MVSDKLSIGIRNEEKSRKILESEIEASVDVSSETNKYPIDIPRRIKIEPIIRIANKIEGKFEKMETPNARSATTRRIMA